MKTFNSEVGIAAGPPPAPTRPQPGPRRVGRAPQGVPGWGERRPSWVRGGGASLCPAPLPRARGGGGLGEGRPGAEGGSGASSALLQGRRVGGEAPLGPPPEAPGRSLGVSSAEAWPAHLFPGPAGFPLAAGRRGPDLPRVLNEAGPG